MFGEAGQTNQTLHVKDNNSDEQKWYLMLFHMIFNGFQMILNTVKHHQTSSNKAANYKSFGHQTYLIMFSQQTFYVWLGLYFPHTIQHLLIKYTSGFFMLFTFRVVEKRSLNYKWSVYSGQRSIAFELAIFTLIRTKRTKICFKILGKKIIYINMYTYIYINIYMYIYRADSVLTF